MFLSVKPSAFMRLACGSLRFNRLSASSALPVLSAATVSRTDPRAVCAMKSKYFAIKNGFRTGIFYGVWSQYEGYVKGYSGARFKSFQSKHEAEQYMSEEAASQPQIQPKKRKLNQQPMQPTPQPQVSGPPQIVYQPVIEASTSGQDAASESIVLQGPGAAKVPRRPLSGDDQVFIVEFDGASRGNPGRAGAGAVVRSSRTGKLLLKAAKRLRTGSTNNEAEYEGLILGLQEAISLGVQRVEVKGDSKLVVNQVRGHWQINKDHLRVLQKQVLELSRSFLSFSISHVLREYNSDADEMSNYAIDRGDVRTVNLDSYQ